MFADVLKFANKISRIRRLYVAKWRCYLLEKRFFIAIRLPDGMTKLPEGYALKNKILVLKILPKM